MRFVPKDYPSKRFLYTLSVGILLLLGLAGCAGLKDTSALGTTTSVPRETVDALAGSLKAAETGAKIYVQLPLCPQPVLCREPGVAAKIGDADTQADAVLRKYRAGQASVADVTAAIAAMVALIPVSK